MAGFAGKVAAAGSMGMGVTTGAALTTGFGAGMGAASSRLQEASGRSNRAERCKFFVPKPR